MAYWGAAMTYNHPFWDAPSKADEAAAWALVQKGMAAKKASPRPDDETKLFYGLSILGAIPEGICGISATLRSGRPTFRGRLHAPS
jgi:hypothetical protein